MGIDPDAIEDALAEVRVPGRFEVYKTHRGFSVVIDYAHTPDAIDSVLGTIRRITSGRIITVFGAGGDRDREKRPLMGKIAQKWSDLILITSDNPRSEDPADIARDTAIEKALTMAKRGDVVALLGKGDEAYQEIRGVKYPFSDREVVEAALARDGI